MRELFADVYERADVVTVNSKPQAQYDEPLDVLEAIDNGATDWDSIAELGRVIAGTDPGRCDNDQITLHRATIPGWVSGTRRQATRSLRPPWLPAPGAMCPMSCSTSST